MWHQQRGLSVYCFTVLLCKMRVNSERQPGAACTAECMLENRCHDCRSPNIHRVAQGFLLTFEKIRCHKFFIILRIIVFLRSACMPLVRVPTRPTICTHRFSPKQYVRALLVLTALGFIWSHTVSVSTKFALAALALLCSSHGVCEHYKI